MKLKDLLGGKGGTALGDQGLAPASWHEAWPDIEITGITADSREVRPGFVFAALPGSNSDGAQFIPAALAAGAVAVLAPDKMHPLSAPDVPVILDADPRRRLALMAARFYPQQPATIVAVTGTNGKTSVVSFVRQIWARLGIAAASLGTVGLVTPRGEEYATHTTPEPVTLHCLMARIAGEGVTHLAIEASSHGLQQRRLDGLVIAAAGFTNITRDHLDYHRDFDDYFTQKRRLFETLLPPGGCAVLNADSDESAFIGGRVRRAEPGLRLMTTGWRGETLRLLARTREGFAQRLDIMCLGRRYALTLPLAGDFQVSNALVAAGLVMASGGDPEGTIGALEHLKGATGRLERVGQTRAGATVIVDYAHTPDALATVLDALRPYAANRLIVVFGCGGNRDTGKRPQMGAIAAAKADSVIVTDDNPRTEQPAAIRAAILATTPGAIEIADRRLAIEAAIAQSGSGDVILIAGKGHETGQIVGDTILPFSDHAVILARIAAGG